MLFIRLCLAAVLLWASPLAAQDVSRLQAPSAAAESSRVLCATSCVLTGFQVNTGASAVWVMLFNATAVPSNGAVTPVKWYQVAANSTAAVAWPSPISLTVGATVACSTTGPFTQTLTATCTISGEVR